MHILLDIFIDILRYVIIILSCIFMVTFSYIYYCKPSWSHWYVYLYVQIHVYIYANVWTCTYIYICIHALICQKNSFPKGVKRHSKRKCFKYQSRVCRWCSGKELFIYMYLHIYEEFFCKTRHLALALTLEPDFFFNGA